MRHTTVRRCGPGCDGAATANQTRTARPGRGAARNAKSRTDGDATRPHARARWSSWARGSRAAGTAGPSPLRARYIEISNRCRMHPLPLRINRCGSRSARAPQQSTQPCFTCTAVSTRRSLPTALSLNSQSAENYLSRPSPPTSVTTAITAANSTAHTTFGQARARAARRAAAPTCRRVVLSAKSRRAHMPTPSRMAAKARQISGRPWQDGLWVSHPPSRSGPCSRR